MTDRALTTVSHNIPMVADAMSLAEAFARSGFFSDATDAAKAIVKIQAGRELGIPPVAAMTGINIVQGRIALGANILAGLVKRHPAYDYRIIEQTEERCEVAFFQDGEQVGTSVFTMDDAKTAGLASKQNWRTYPRNMLFARAISNGVRWYCPDVTAGAPVYTPDELDQPVGEDGNMSAWATQAQREAVKERLRELFPDVEFKNDGHYNYLLKRNSYPSLRDMSAEQAIRILGELTHGGSTGEVVDQGPETVEADYTAEPVEDEPPAPKLRTDLTGVGRDVSELTGKPDPTLPDFTGWRPNELARFCSLASIKLGFGHEKHARKVLLDIFPEAEKTPPAWADAWAMLVQHQQEAGRL